ncbi:hypothetical protein AVEN_172939-1 [Araneus ventricosus]|uniref:BPTI/Kunitz inhibitor domain-containing protein n=1 Tax=Araneus ventricosus TaxID=182803 RepID=A0A4Y2WL98_ARAVE|nr:hypothetical protein AVEN_172939-1 [Araneus ventricosus]
MIAILLLLCFSLTAKLACCDDDYGESYPDAGYDNDEEFSDLSFHSEDCDLKKDPGPCNKYHQRWYYKPKRRTCLPFSYGGCEGNGNNFKSFDMCVIRCLLAPR